MDGRPTRRGTICGISTTFHLDPRFRVSLISAEYLESIAARPHFVSEINIKLDGLKLPNGDHLWAERVVLLEIALCGESAVKHNFLVISRLEELANVKVILAQSINIAETIILT